MTEHLKDQIKFVAEILSNKFGISKVFLFGSYAYGNPKSGSDIDLCLVTKLGGKRKIDLLHDMRLEISNSFQSPIDLLIYEDSEFEERSAIKSTLEYKILKEGVLISFVNRKSIS